MKSKTTKTSKTTSKAKATTDTTYRVYRLPKSLRIAASKARAVKGQTVQEFVQNAIDGELDAILQDLRVVYQGRHDGQKGPARLPLSDKALATLKEASALGLPASLLLELALTRAAAKAGSKPGRKRKA